MVGAVEHVTHVLGRHWTKVVAGDEGHVMKIRRAAAASGNLGGSQLLRNVSFANHATSYLRISVVENLVARFVAKEFDSKLLKVKCDGVMDFVLIILDPGYCSIQHSGISNISNLK